MSAAKAKGFEFLMIRGNSEMLLDGNLNLSGFVEYNRLSFSIARDLL